MPKVIIDAGHGGNDAGDIVYNRYEKNDNLRLALAVGEKLQKDYGFEVIYTRTKDAYLTQMERANIANSEGGDLLISIHRIIGELPTAGSRLGFYIDEMGGISERVSNNIASELQRLGFITYSLEIRTDLPILRATSIPSLMFAIGRLNSQEDNEYFDSHLDEIAAALAEGIADTLSISTALEHYHIQTGIFTDVNKAMEVQLKMYMKGYPTNIIETGDYFTLSLGEYNDIDEAANAELWLRKEGYNTHMISS
ncbi:MAG TPA: N-acetylmuramoyl-L-alanine amidase [Mobilitalea sp.]|nr:N-acetylmuramoyl-L-alanine amidase [Mobilitalea sp.]